ncbi:hypothetical protein [Streptoalloteichus hindustanus]|uniref:ARB-07466-like C-terminal domain-containing protein n=1 Tax=Streptoalloteichus hindustanus TaxID=2017 RepID=A0A1M4YBV5_STRHI|nr:hypothetical protein [Streptoalloteichus hindustanus]SHF03088.1 hypothetical protein SAMN05444320_102304 [Streptoalloteichus hindustanus]
MPRTLARRLVTTVALVVTASAALVGPAFADPGQPTEDVQQVQELAGLLDAAAAEDDQAAAPEATEDDQAPAAEVAEADLEALAASCGSGSDTAKVADPTNSRYKVTRRMCVAYKATEKHAKDKKIRWSKGQHCFRNKDGKNYHYDGVACDLMYVSGGGKATGSTLTKGNNLKKWLVANHKRLKLDHVMWQGRIYSPRTNWSQSGRPQPGCADGKGGNTVCHRDHIHVAVKR